MWGALASFFKAVLLFLFDLASRPADVRDASAPKDLKEDLNAQINDLPPTPDD